MVFAAPKLPCGFPAKMTSYTVAVPLGSFAAHSQAVRLIIHQKGGKGGGRP